MNHEFCRISWASQEAEKVWKSRTAKIEPAWTEFERYLVSSGKRQAALQFTSVDKLVELQEWARTHGLAVLIVSNNPMYGLRYALTKKPTTFYKAWCEGDFVTIGRMLGYPECCIREFVRVWREWKLIDTTWDMAGNTVHICKEEAVIGPSPYSSIMLHWLGVRFVPHLPCSFNCMQTIQQGKENAHAWKETGQEVVVAWAKEMLSWPVEWTALHGIAEIKTPVVRILCNTDTTNVRRVIRVQGKQYPLHGVLLSTEDLKQDTWTDNGFPTEDAMIKHHDPLLQTIGERAKDGIQRVVDLGCGNGELLDKVAQLSSLEVIGVEMDKAKIARGRRNETVKFITGNIFKVAPKANGKPTLALLSTQRLKEATSAQLVTFLPSLTDLCEEVMLYGYGDYDPMGERQLSLYGWKRVTEGHDLIVMRGEPSGMASNR